MHFTVEPTEGGDKVNSMSANLGDSTAAAASQETRPCEGRSPMACLSETQDSSTMAEKKAASELPQDVPGTEGSVPCLCDGGILPPPQSELSVTCILRVLVCAHSCCSLTVPSLFAE